jgi:dihydroorotase
LCGLDARGLGKLAVGGPADVTVVDPDAPWTVRAGDHVGKSKNTPFEGRQVRGRALATIAGGEVRYSTETPGGRG